MTWAPTLPRVEKLSWNRKDRISTRSIPLDCKRQTFRRWKYSFPFGLFHFTDTRDTRGEQTCTVLRYCRVKYQSWEAVSSSRNWNPAEVMHGASPASLTERAKQKAHYNHYSLLKLKQKKKKQKQMFTSSWGQPGWGAERGPGWPPRLENPPWSAGWPPSAPWHTGPGSLRPWHADQDRDCCPHLPMVYHWSTGILKQSQFCLKIRHDLSTRTS